jgi:DNA-binding NarL/FixJ family response regulator
MNSTGTIKVALIDDHAMIRNCLHNCLTLWGYSVVIQAYNGKDFFNQLSVQDPPGICIVDINMPEMNGYITVKLLKERCPEIKTLVFSMNINSGTNHTHPVDADAVLSKMAPISELKKILEQLSQQKPVLFE